MVLPVSDHLCISTIGDNIDTALISQRKDQLLEHLLEPQSVVIEMFRGIVAVDANIRQVQPIVRTDHSDTPTEIAQPLIELSRDEAFTASIDARNSDKCSASVRRGCSGADDRLDQLAQTGYFAGVSHPLVVWIVRYVSVVIQAAIAPGFSWLLEGALVIFILSTGGQRQSAGYNSGNSHRFRLFYARVHPFQQVIAHPKRVGHDRQRRVYRAARAEEARIHNVEIV